VALRAGRASTRGRPVLWRLRAEFNVDRLQPLSADRKTEAPDHGWRKKSPAHDEAGPGKFGCARNMHPQMTRSLRNLTRRQRQARRALWALGTASTTEISQPRPRADRRGANRPSSDHRKANYLADTEGLIFDKYRPCLQPAHMHGGCNVKRNMISVFK
jgi:hypothetical protein